MKAISSCDDKVDSCSHATMMWVFLASIILQLLSYDRTLNLYDEGIILVGAERVLSGEIPYRDFWTMYGPAQFYILAGLFKIFGVSDLWLRIYGFLIKAVISVQTYALVDRLGNKRYALIASTLVIFLLIKVRNDGFPIFPAVMLSLLSISFFDLGRNAAIGKRVYFILSGLCVGLAATFRHDLGAYIALSIGISSIASAMLENGLTAAAVIAKKAMLELSFFAIGILLIVSPVVLLLISIVPLNELYDCLIRIPGAIYPAVRSLPFPGLSDVYANGDFHSGALGDFIVYLPFWVPILAAVAEVCVRKAKCNSSKNVVDHNAFYSVNFLAIALMVACMLFALKGVVRVSVIHMASALILVVILCGIWLSRVGFVKNNYARSFHCFFLLAVLFIFPESFGGLKLGVKSALEIASNSKEFLNSCLMPEIKRLPCVKLDKDYQKAAGFVMENTVDGDAIYVGTGRADKIFVNATAFYFVVERKSATRWHELHPGVQTTESVQSKMINEFERNNPKWLILDERWDGVSEPNESSRSSGVTLLDDYIRENYQEEIQVGTIRLMSRGQR